MIDEASSLKITGPFKIHSTIGLALGHAAAAGNGEGRKAKQLKERRDAKKNRWKKVVTKAIWMV